MTPEEIKHIAFSFIHNGFDPDSYSRGCFCSDCWLLREAISEQKRKEITEYLKEHGV